MLQLCTPQNTPSDSVRTPETESSAYEIRLVLFSRRLHIRMVVWGYAGRAEGAVNHLQPRLGEQADARDVWYEHFHLCPFPTHIRLLRVSLVHVHFAST
jgi:hypothetical protein